jgi:C4-type Zn-finger protein
MKIKEKTDCPYCDGIASLQKEAKEIKYRNEVFNIVAHFYKCKQCSEEFTTTEADSISITQVHDQYQAARGH